MKELHVSVSPDCTKFAFMSRKDQLEIWPVDGTEEHSKQVNCPARSHINLRYLQFSPDATKLAGVFHNGTMMIWDLKSGEKHQCCTLNAHFFANSIAFSRDGSRLASGHDDCTLRLWDVDSGEELFNAFAELAIISSVHSADDIQVTLEFDDCTVRLRDVDEELLEHHFKAFLVHKSPVISVAYSPGGVKIATGTEDGTLSISDIKTGDDMTLLTWAECPVTLIAFSPDGTKIVSSYRVGNIMLWDVDSGEMIRQIGHNFLSINAMMFSSDGNEIIFGSGGAEIGLCDVESGDAIPIGIFGGYARHVNSIAAFSTSGMQIISGCQDGTVRVWSRMKVCRGSGTVTGSLTKKFCFFIN